VNHSEIVSFLWGVADLIRDTFKRGKYQDVILPLTVLRRLDCVLARTKEKVLGKQAELRGKKLENLDPQLRKASGFAFYNTSRYDFDKLLGDAPHLAANLRNYIAGFSPNMREVLEKFDFDNTISKLAEAGLLFQVLERFKNVAPGQNRQPDDGHDLRGADPQVQRGAGREPRRALHAARRRAPDGRSDAGRRRVRDPREEGDSPAGRWLRGSPNRSKLDQPHRTLGRPSMESTA
jgi:hypothetical protein